LIDYEDKSRTFITLNSLVQLLGAGANVSYNLNQKVEEVPSLYEEASQACA
jgi:hypothetical protein